MNSFTNNDVQIDEECARLTIGRAADQLIAFGINDLALADAMIIRALAIVAAKSGNEAGASELLKQWHDFAHGI